VIGHCELLMCPGRSVISGMFIQMITTVESLSRCWHVAKSTILSPKLIVKAFIGSVPCVCCVWATRTYLHLEQVGLFAGGSGGISASSFRIWVNSSSADTLLDQYKVKERDRLYYLLNVRQEGSWRRRGIHIHISSQSNRSSPMRTEHLHIIIVAIIDMASYQHEPFYGALYLNTFLIIRLAELTKGVLRTLQKRVRSYASLTWLDNWFRRAGAAALKYRLSLTLLWENAFTYNDAEKKQSIHELFLAEAYLKYLNKDIQWLFW